MMDNGTSKNAAPETSPTRRGMWYLAAIVITLAVSGGLSFLLISNSIFVADNVIRLIPEPGDSLLNPHIPADQLEAYNDGMKKEIKGLTRKLENLLPRQPYLVVNTTHNTFQLMNNGQLIREGVCSTGSYTILTFGKDQRWVFETPRGMLKVRSKQRFPVWIKPDWAFIEEGLPVPSPRHISRYEYGTLGDYKLELGDGYLIHGTLYKRFLGMAVTHGCIRLGDEDLKAVYKNLRLGSKVFIY